MDGGKSQCCRQTTRVTRRSQNNKKRRKREREKRKRRKRKIKVRNLTINWCVFSLNIFHSKEKGYDITISALVGLYVSQVELHGCCLN